MSYLRSKAAPFAAGPLPCVPDAINLPSQKLRLRQHGTFATGTTGDGFVCVAPFTPSTNGAALTGTSATSVGTYGGTALVSYTNKVSTSWKNAEKTAAVIDSDDTAFRPVAVAVRVKYIGPAAYRSGLITTLSSPNNFSILTQAANLTDDFSELTEPVGEGWHTVMFVPKVTADLAYRDNTSNDGVFGFGITGTYDASGAVGPAAFAYDIVGYYEMTGVDVTSATPSGSDAAGLAAVNTVMGDTIHVGVPPQGGMDVAVERLKRVLINGMSYALSNPGRAAANLRAAHDVLQNVRGIHNFNQIGN